MTPGLRFLLFVFTIILGIAPCSGQKNSTVEGTVRSTDQQVIPFANLVLYRSVDSTFVKGTTSDLEGRYIISAVAAGKYYVIVSSIGFVASTVSVTVDGSRAQSNVIDITLSEEATNLQEVTIQGQRQTIRQEAGSLVVEKRIKLGTVTGRDIETCSRCNT